MWNRLRKFNKLFITIYYVALKKDKKKIKDPWREVKRLENENKKLIDENSSLWFLLDEFEKSSIFNKEHRDKFDDAFKKLRNISMMTHSKVEEA
tara:strand:+ start:103 stop:384 length:282 start_codon:yes stop_codon:yes gene_type:complete